MRESAVRGPAIDLDEFERRLRVRANRSMEKPASTPTSVSDEKLDPLEELARIIRGGRVGAPLTTPQHASPADVTAEHLDRASLPPARWPTPSVEAPRYPETGSLRGTYPGVEAPEEDYVEDGYYSEPNYQSVGYEHGEYEPAAAGDYADYGEPTYGEPTYGEAETGWPETDVQDYAYDSVQPPPPAISPARRLPDLAGKLRPWHAIAAISVVAVVSIGWGVAHRMGGSGSHEIALIPPPEGPLKIKPTVETGADAPSPGGTAVLDRTETAPVRQIVTSQEQAVDPSVPQDILQIGAGPVEAPHELPPASTTQPRRVKTVAVRPEAAPPVSEARATSGTPAPVVDPAPQPAVKTTQTPAASPAAPATAAGGFAVQFGAAGSEAEARALIKTLSEKYGAVLGGRKLSFKPATVGDKKVFRVRIGGLAKDAAESLCGRLKAGGGACFVAAN